MTRLTTKKPRQLKLKFPKTARFEPLKLPHYLEVDNLKYHRRCGGMARNGKTRGYESMAAYQHVLDEIIRGYNAYRLRRMQQLEEKSP